MRFNVIKFHSFVQKKRKERGKSGFLSREKKKEEDTEKQLTVDCITADKLQFIVTRIFFFYLEKIKI